MRVEEVLIVHRAPTWSQLLATMSGVNSAWLPPFTSMPRFNKLRSSSNCVERVSSSTRVEFVSKKYVLPSTRVEIATAIYPHLDARR